MFSWKAGAVQSVNRQILNATLIIGSLTFFVHVGTSAKELLVAYRFGIADDLDAFLIAVLLPTLAVTVLAGSFSSAVIPVYLEVEKRKGVEAAYGLYTNVLAAAIGVYLTATVLLALIAAPVLTLLDFSFTPGKLFLTRSLFYMTLPLLVIKGIAILWASILNAANRFILAAIIPAITPAITIVALLEVGTSWGIYALAFGTVVGALLEAAVLASHLRRTGIPLWPRWNGWTPALAQVLRQYRSLVVGAALMSSTTFVDQAMAAMLGPGSVAALSYGGKVLSFMVVVGATALGTAVLPHFSKMVAAGDWSGLRHTVQTYVRLILWITIPVTCVTVALSEPLAQVLFQRGAFTFDDTQTVSRVQALLLLQLPFYVIGILIVRLISSLKANSILMWGCVMNFVLNVVLNYVLMQWLQVAGIALSTAIVIMVSSGYLGLMLMRLLKARETAQVDVTESRDFMSQPVTHHQHSG